MSNRQEQNPELAEVFVSIDPTPLRIARDMLESAGIECFVFDRESSRMLGTAAAVPTRLMVRAEDAEEARKQLKDLGFAE